MRVESVQWTFENIDNITSQGELKHLAEFLSKKQFDLVINLPMRNGGARRVSSFMTHGYRTRRLAIDYSIPLVTDVKCTKLLVEALRLVRGPPPMKTHTDCMSSRRLVRLPGLIDTHVHVREPGATHKEDYASCTAAALAGGITMICAMPNTNPPVTDQESLELVRNLAKKSARCDYAIYMGASEDNYKNISELASEVAGLKMYLNDTFTSLKLTDITVWSSHLKHWPKRKPLVVHAESQTTAAIILMASLQNRPLHICHVARKEEILIIKAAKEKGYKITCEVCPHHLFLSKEDFKKLGNSKSEVRPVLGTLEDQQALWDNLHVIDCFATDHAPHTLEEKLLTKAPPGFPGLETILALLLNAVNENQLTIDDIIEKFYVNPMRIFNLPEQGNTYVEVDLDEEWTIPEILPYSKSKWTPFAGRKVKGRVHRVVLRGEVAYVDGQVLIQPGFGQDVRSWENKKAFIDNQLGVEFDDGVTNEAFKKLLKPEKVHFEDLVATRSTQNASPTPGRIRTDSFSNLVAETSAIVAAHPPCHRNHNLATKHILSVDMFSKEQLNDIFEMAQLFKAGLVKERLDHILKGKIMASMFYEVSTRTSCSFSAAMQRLGGGVIYMDDTNSSVKKGETLEDSLAVQAGYADVIVLRHPTPGSIMKASHHCRKPLINAGDGIGEHPTQALLDIFTIREETGTVNGKTITLVGDLKNGRTVHSLARLLTLYNVQLRYVSPASLKMPEHIQKFVASRGILQEEYSTLEEVLPDTDILYMTRIQKERFESEEEYKKVCGHFIVTPQLMTKAKTKIRVLHPLPRVFEISPEFDTDPRAAYFRQAEYGMYVRMAILAMVLGKCKNCIKLQ